MKRTFYYVWSERAKLIVDVFPTKEEARKMIKLYKRNDESKYLITTRKNGYN